MEEITDQASFLELWIRSMPEKLKEKLGFNQTHSQFEEQGHADVVWLRFDSNHLSRFNVNCSRCGLPQPPQYSHNRLLPERAESMAGLSGDLIVVDDVQYVIGHDPAKGEDVSGYVVVEIKGPDKIPDVAFAFKGILDYWLNKLWYDLD